MRIEACGSPVALPLTLESFAGAYKALSELALPLTDSCPFLSLFSGVSLSSSHEFPLPKLVSVVYNQIPDS